MTSSVCDSIPESAASFHTLGSSSYLAAGLYSLMLDFSAWSWPRPSVTPLLSLQLTSSVWDSTYQLAAGLFSMWLDFLACSWPRQSEARLLSLQLASSVCGSTPLPPQCRVNLQTLHSLVDWIFLCTPFVVQLRAPSASKTALQSENMQRMTFLFFERSIFCTDYSGDGIYTFYSYSLEKKHEFSYNH